MTFIAFGGLVVDILKLTLYIACAYLAIAALTSHVKTPWLLELAGRRFAVLSLLTLLVAGVKVFEDVLSKESGPIDTTALWFIKQYASPAWLGFFSAVTWSGAAIFLVPATSLLCTLLLWAQHPREAILLVASMTSGWALTYTLKTMIDRPRPELWSTTWYWGSSFPSGHTLSTAAFATALTLIAARIWPLSRRMALPLAVLWISLMGMSRLVLGVHWPTDVLAAICIGVFIPLAINMVLDLHQSHSAIIR
ncbi:MAG: phosphatase PAP2 family protein [Polaromonas sp.]